MDILCLPANVTSITFGDEFNRSVDYLPVTVISIIFGYHFDQKTNFQMV